MRSEKQTHDGPGGADPCFRLEHFIPPNSKEIIEKNVRLTTTPLKIKPTIEIGKRRGKDHEHLCPGRKRCASAAKRHARRRQIATSSRRRIGFGSATVDSGPSPHSYSSPGPSTFQTTLVESVEKEWPSQRTAASWRPA